MIEIIKSTGSDFLKIKEALSNKKIDSGKKEIETVVKEIIEEVKTNQDLGILKYVQLFEGKVLKPEHLKIEKKTVKEAYEKVSKDEIAALTAAAKRIKDFHEKQLSKEASSWQYKKNGIELGQLIRPLHRVGVYVPGGKASYPSSVLMGVIPARVAGVNEIILCTPFRKEGDNPYTLIAADIAGADKIFRVGGAQAIAGMAYGTALIPKVDKIVGPGNIYVTLAKKMVFGVVDIDMLAGPTEIVIIADEFSRAEFIAADLLSQAEHDEMAEPILITPSENFAHKVISSISQQFTQLIRKDIIEKSLNKGKIFVVRNLDEAIDLSNSIAPEHLEIAIKNPHKILPRIKNAGAIFLGEYSPQAIGDYLAGPNHILPTANTARFSSPLGVYDFMKRTSIISSSKKALQTHKKNLMAFSRMEGLDAHGQAVKIRL